MKACNVVTTMALVMLASGCSEPEVNLPEVNNENCVMGVIDALPEEARYEFKNACREFKDEQARKHNFKRGKARDYLK